MKYWRDDARVSSKFGGERDGWSSPGTRSVSINITRDEWRSIHDWMHYSLGESENTAIGHFLLQIDGCRRTWVTTDDAQITAIEVEGLPPVGDYNPSWPLRVLVNSRLFRGADAADATLVLTDEGGRRMQTLRRDGVTFTLPEPAGTFPDWERSLGRIEGVEVEVEAQHLVEACDIASVSPMGRCNHGTAEAWLRARNGKLIIESVWDDHAPSRVEIDLVKSAPDTAAVLVDPRRLRMLLVAVDLPTVRLTIPHSPRGAFGIRSGDYSAGLVSLDCFGPVRDRVEALLQQILSLDSIEPDEEGDYSVVSPSGQQLWVRLYGHADPVNVQVFSVLATNIEPTPELMCEINSINASAAYAKVLWKDGAVIVEVDLSGKSLARADIANALEMVGLTVDRYGSILGSYFVVTDVD